MVIKVPFIWQKRETKEQKRIENLEK